MVRRKDRDMFGQDKSLGCSATVPLSLYQGPSFPRNPCQSITLHSESQSTNPCRLFLARPVLKGKAVPFKFNAMCDWSQLGSKIVLNHNI